MAVTIRNAGDQPPMIGGILIRGLLDPDEVPPGWTLGGNPQQDWFAYRRYTSIDTYQRSDSAITPVDWRNASYGTAVEALHPRQDR